MVKSGMILGSCALHVFICHTKDQLIARIPQGGGNEGKNVVLFPPIQHSFKSAVVLEGTVAFYAQGIK